ncbi:hypothetical protein BAE44_0007813 [Dichanthelium oligosanthes]|uniref:Uncharacterized protein n=1 Tax=Dichanthelium oligosanthes TaxID=888268 RepID=A0A1E5W1A9_9POAL|nr:hypothetical protein BAE44_0007813 [Dichanthelium oligosanthes]
MGVRIAARFHSHCPQTARMYYKQPQTSYAATTSSSSAGAADDAAKARSFGCDAATAFRPFAMASDSGASDRPAGFQRHDFDTAQVVVYEVI